MADANTKLLRKNLERKNDPGVPGRRGQRSYPQNPVRFAEKMRYREPMKQKNAFTAEEVSSLMERRLADRIGLIIYLILRTAMITRELLVLEPLNS